jgi:hypothetical protein
MRTAGWECPCGQEKPKRGATATPNFTLVSAMEPFCPFCGRIYHQQIVEGFPAALPAHQPPPEPGPTLDVS